MKDKTLFGPTIQAGDYAENSSVELLAKLALLDYIFDVVLDATEDKPDDSEWTYPKIIHEEMLNGGQEKLAEAIAAGHLFPYSNEEPWQWVSIKGRSPYFYGRVSGYHTEIVFSKDETKVNSVYMEVD